MAKEMPQACPRCAADATILKINAHRWRVRCSLNTGIVGPCDMAGHTMFTRNDAVLEWNKLTPPPK